jgi:hypothetical protein
MIRHHPTIWCYTTGIVYMPQVVDIAYVSAWDQEEILERLRLRKIVLSSSPGEGDSCGSETKHSRRTAPRPTLFAWKRRSQERRPQPWKPALGSYLCNCGPCNSETKHSITAPRPDLFVSKGSFQEQKPEPRKYCPGFETWRRQFL